MSSKKCGFETEVDKDADGDLGEGKNIESFFKDRAFHLDKLEPVRDNNIMNYFKTVIDAFKDCKEIYTSDVAGLRRAISDQRKGFDHKRTPTSTRYDLYGKEDYAEMFALQWIDKNGNIRFDMDLFLYLLNEFGFKTRYKKPRIVFPPWFNWDKYPNLKRLYKVE